MIYLTRMRLMVESERTVEEHARHGEELARRVCVQLLAEPTRYSLWHSRHEYRMDAVAEARRREQQIFALRAFSVQQLHRAALVNYLRNYRVVGAARAETLRYFYGVVDPQEAAVTEHRDYLVATSSQLCASELLGFVGDRGGVDLLRRYDLAYSQFFSMFCEYSRARQNGQPYLLASLLPEVRATAERLRRRVLDGEALPPRKVPIAPRVRTEPTERVRAAAEPVRATAPPSEPHAAAKASWPRALIIRAMKLVRLPHSPSRH